MHKNKLECLITKTDDQIHLMSPSVGRVEICIEEGQYIKAGQMVAVLWRLGSCFALMVPEGCSGQVVAGKNHQKYINMGYGEAFIKLAVKLEPRARLARGDSPPKSVEHGFKQESVVAPMDGMFYLSASPKDPPFVTVGQAIKSGQTLGLIEVMKCFYPLQYSGQTNATVVSVSIKNATPVTCGTEIFLIEKA